MNKILKLNFKYAIFLSIPSWLIVFYIFFSGYILPVNRHAVLEPQLSFPNFTKIHYFLNSYSKGFSNYLNSLVIEEDSNIKRIDLIISEEALQKLNQRLPFSGKVRKHNAQVLFNGQKFQGKVGYRGFSHWHWSFPHKSFKVELENGLILGTSTFDIINPKIIFAPLEILAHKFARELGLNQTNLDLVNLYVNGKLRGVSLFQEVINKKFFYQHQSPRGELLGVDNEILVKSANPKKEMPLNIDEVWRDCKFWLVLYSTNSNSDCTLMNKLLKITSTKDHSQFVNFAYTKMNREKYISYMANDAILGIFHHSINNSQRHFINYLSGKLEPISWDHVNWKHEEDILLSYNPIFDLWRETPFLKFQLDIEIWRLINSTLSFTRIHSEMEAMYKKSYHSFSRDPYKDGLMTHRPLMLSFTRIVNFNMSDYDKEFQVLLRTRKKRDLYIKKYFESASIESNFYNGVLSVENHGNVAAQIYFSESVKRLNSHNRQNSYKTKSEIIMPGHIYYFKYSKNISFRAENYFTKNKVIHTTSNSHFSVSPYKNHHPWYMQNIEEKYNRKFNRTIGPGVIDINENIIVYKNESLTLRPGTTLRFAPNTGIISYGKLIAQNGSSPVSLESLDGSWAGVVLSGENILSNLLIRSAIGFKEYDVISSESLVINNSTKTNIHSLEIIGHQILNHNAILINNSNINFEKIKITKIKGSGLETIHSSVNGGTIFSDFVLKDELTLFDSKLKVNNLYSGVSGMSNLVLTQSSNFSCNNLKSKSHVFRVKLDKSSSYNFPKHEIYLKKERTNDF